MSCVWWVGVAGPQLSSTVRSLHRTACCMTYRPFRHSPIDELEEGARREWFNYAPLRTIAQELQHRNSQRAVELRIDILRQLNQLEGSLETRTQFSSRWFTVDLAGDLVPTPVLRRLLRRFDRRERRAAAGALVPLHCCPICGVRTIYNWCKRCHGRAMASEHARWDARGTARGGEWDPPFCCDPDLAERCWQRPLRCKPEELF